MKNEISIKQPAPKKAMQIMADRLRVDPVKLHETLTKTVFAIREQGGKVRQPTDEELLSLVVVSNEHGLNPLTKQIYAFPKKGGGIEPMVSVDGWLHIINAHPQFDGMETVDINNDDGTLMACECKIYRKDRNHPTVIREYLTECKRDTDPWNTMPRRMLRHKSIMQCGRISMGISGIVDEDDAHVISERSVSGKVVNDDPLMPTIEPKPKEEPAPTLELTNDVTLMELLQAKAKKQGVPIEALFGDAEEAGLIDTTGKRLEDFTDEELRKVLG